MVTGDTGHTIATINCVSYEAAELQQLGNNLECKQWHSVTSKQTIDQIIKVSTDAISPSPLPALLSQHSSSEPWHCAGLITIPPVVRSFKLHCSLFNDYYDYLIGSFVFMSPIKQQSNENSCILLAAVAPCQSARMMFRFCSCFYICTTDGLHDAQSHHHYFIPNVFRLGLCRS